MNENKQFFHFTLGPVQSFVGQARRTRDFWAGSFLLSWLSGVAMQSVLQQNDGNRIVFPEADETFLKAIGGGANYIDTLNNTEKQKLKQGSIPNRFKAEVYFNEGDKNDPKNFDGSKVVADVQSAWEALAQKIYDEDVKKYQEKIEKAIQEFKDKDKNQHFKDFLLEPTNDKDTNPKYSSNIWKRQIENFWEMTWVVVDNIENSSALDRRKNWRTHYLPDEAGIKCSLMGDWQELSGIEGVSKNDNEARKLFWKTVLNPSDKTIADYGENEFLCAMAFIKRRFIYHFNQEFSLTKIKSNRVKEKGALEKVFGWELKNDVPSVDYIAAANWWANILRKCNSENQQHLISFFDAIKDNGKGGEICKRNEYNSSIQSIEHAIEENIYNLTDAMKLVKAIKARNEPQIREELSGIDGVLFYKSALENPHNFPNPNKNPDNTNDTECPELNLRAKDVATALGKLIKNFAIGEPSPFYAILMMDGDSLGKQMSDRNKQDHITHALNAFTNKVDGIISENNGFLIYAGGDDVLALLPIEDALNCAENIRSEYENCFKKEHTEANKKNVNIDYSISAAIVYSHINNPLSNALHDIHNLLDDVAKEKTGRNALAVQVCKQSGTVLTWAKPWDTKRLSEEDKEKYQRGDTALDEQSGANRACVLSSLLADFQKAEKDNPQFSNRFFYKIRENFDLFNSEEDKKNPEEQPLLNIEHATKIMAAEFRQSRGINETSLQEAEDFVQPLMRLCRDSQGNIKADAALLIRFLANYSQPKEKKS